MLVEPPMNPSPQRAVITGVGAVTPLGGLAFVAAWFTLAWGLARH